MVVLPVLKEWSPGLESGNSEAWSVGEQVWVNVVLELSLGAKLEGAL